MTHRHFKSIAEAVRITIKYGNLDDMQIDILISNLADACRKYNVRFDLQTFSQACRG